MHSRFAFFWGSLVVFLVAMLFPSLGEAQDYYPDRLSDISWSPANFGTAADIQAAFNNARTNENGQNLGAGQVQMPMMTMPSQAEWDGKSKTEKALWLINSERVARGLLPFQGIDNNVISVAQGHADYLMANNLFSHTGSGGTSPWQRLDANVAINGHHDFLGVAENIFAFYSWPGPNPMTIERAVYGWNYVDASSSWGHRHAFLWKTFTNNYGDPGSEGLMGIGSATGAYGSGCGCNGGGMWPAGDVLVFNVFDPDATYNPALPVQLVSFTGVVTAQNDVRLDWRTISEINNFGFYVERKRFGELQFEQIPNSFIPGHGTTNQPHDYTFTDRGISAGVWRYRLRQVDLDGTVHFSEPIQINVLTAVREQAPLEFALNQNYPNPFNPTTTIEYALPTDARVTLEVFDVLGRLVAELVNGNVLAGNHSVEFNASGLASGIYLYRINVAGFDGKAFHQMRKLMLMK